MEVSSGNVFVKFCWDAIEIRGWNQERTSGKNESKKNVLRHIIFMVIEKNHPWRIFIKIYSRKQRGIAGGIHDEYVKLLLIRFYEEIVEKFLDGFIIIDILTFFLQKHFEFNNKFLIDTLQDSFEDNLTDAWQKAFEFYYRFLTILYKHVCWRPSLKYIKQHSHICS